MRSGAHMDREGGDTVIWTHVLYGLAVIGGLVLAVLFAGGAEMLGLGK